MHFVQGKRTGKKSYSQKTTHKNVIICPFRPNWEGQKGEKRKS